MPARIPKITRRRFLIGSGVALGTATTLGLYTWRIEPHWVQVVDRDLPIAHLPPALVGKTLVQLSDLHVGPNVDNDYLAGVMHKVSALEPDMVIVTGDFMTYRDSNQQDQAARIMELLKPSPLGCVAIMGNHDYGDGWRRWEVAAKLVQRLTDLGVQVLRNESRSFGGLNIIGLDDLWGPNFTPDAIMKQVDARQANLVLCHNPDAADQNIWYGYQGWILSGHTHGGQCKPPFLPPPVIPVQNKCYTSGEIELSGGRQLYINRGIGYLLRVRFNARPEITRFRLVAA